MTTSLCVKICTRTFLRSQHFTNITFVRALYCNCTLYAMFCVHTCVYVFYYYYRFCTFFFVFILFLIHFLWSAQYSPVNFCQAHAQNLLPQINQLISQAVQVQNTLLFLCLSLYRSINGYWQIFRVA